METFKLPYVFLVGIAILAGCNTVQGAGQDIESAGDAIEDTARDAQG